MQTLSRVLARLVDAAAALAAIAVALMLLHVTFDVVGKLVFGTPIPGTIAIVSDYYMVAVVFLPLAFAERRDLHISVEVLAERLPRRAQAWLWIAGAALSAAVFVLLTWRGAEEALRKQETGTFIIEHDVRIDTWPAYYLMPLGAALMALALLWRVAGVLRGDPAPGSADAAGADPPDEGDAS